MRLFFLIVAGILFVSGAAFAAGYAEFYVKVDKSGPVDPEVKVLRQAAFDASRQAEIAKLQTMFADKVTIFTASADPDDMAGDRFQVAKVVQRAKIIDEIADQFTLVGKVKVRTGLFAITALLRDPDIGINAKMNGAICNRPVNMPEKEAFEMARALTKSRMAEWLVVKKDMGPSGAADVPGQYPTKIYKDQMVLKSRTARVNSQWTAIIAPDGGKPLLYRNPQSFSIAPYFAKYVASHVCFGKQKGQWKITAFALRDL